MTKREQAQLRKVARHHKMLDDYRALMGVDHPDYRPQLPPPAEPDERYGDYYGERQIDGMTMRGEERFGLIVKNSFRRVMRSSRIH